MTIEEVCTTYYNLIYQRCLYGLYFDEHDAHEATQEVFITLYEKWEQIEHENQDKIKFWLISTAKHKILKAKEQYTKQTATISLSELLSASEPADNSDLLEQLLSEYVTANMDAYEQQIFDKLTEREVTLAKYMQTGMKYADIAKEIGSNEGAVSVAAVRLYKKVKKLVSRLVESL